MSESILPIAQAIAAELGGDWTASSQYEHNATLSRGDSVALFVRWDGYGARKRIHVSESYPERNGIRAHDMIRYDEKDAYVSTTAAKDRAPKAIAAQIRRNVLPTVERFTPIILERLAARDDANAQRRQAFEQIRSAVPAAHDSRGDATEVRLYTGASWYGDARINHDGTTGRLELNGLPMAKILEILAILPTGAES